jgi:hypothetical protein
MLILAGLEPMALPCPLLLALVMPVPRSTAHCTDAAPTARLHTPPQMHPHSSQNVAINPKADAMKARQAFLEVLSQVRAGRSNGAPCGVARAAPGHSRRRAAGWPNASHCDLARWHHQSAYPESVGCG